jgi:excisionase family DNA binding protein
MNQTVDERPPLLISEAAARLGVSDTWIYQRVYRGEIKVIAGFGHLRVPQSELDRLTIKPVLYTPKKRTRKPKEVTQQS